MSGYVVSTGNESREERYHRQQREFDDREAIDYPVADALAQRLHLVRYRQGSALYQWDRMRAEYRRSARDTMRWVVEQFGEEAARKVLS